MIEGFIKTRDIFLHPVSIMQIRGVKGYFKILFRALSPKKHRFISMIWSTSLRLGKKKKQDSGKD